MYIYNYSIYVYMYVHIYIYIYAAYILIQWLSGSVAKANSQFQQSARPARQSTTH